MIRAAAGGQVAINGEFYKGGQFMPENIWCDKWQNACKKSKNKSTVIRAAKKSTHSFVVNCGSSYICFYASEEEASGIWTDLYRRIGRDICGFEYFKNGKRQNASGY